MKQQFIQCEGPIFKAVEQARLFSDSKIFVDSIPKKNPSLLLQEYHANQNNPNFSLKKWIETFFDLPTSEDPHLLKKHGDPLDSIEQTWTILRKKMEAKSPYDSLISLPYPHIVPGGRFRESYYWDSYFVAIGLLSTGHLDWLIEMTYNFASLIQRFHHIPNGNRIYFLSRSQTPFFSHLIALLFSSGKKEIAKEMIPFLEKEYKYWMDLSSLQHAIKYKNFLLNRYFDSKNTPREESYFEDLHTRKLTKDPLLYQHLRAACESGWDFSSRWLIRPENLHSIHTLDLFPIDLNCLLFHMEMLLSIHGSKPHIYKEKASKRKQAIQTLFWDQKRQFFFDFNFRNHRLSPIWTLGGVYPLFVQAATKNQAAFIATHLKEQFLHQGGLSTTLHSSHQQWDYPNGWAPLQWIAIRGLQNYGYDTLAKEIAKRWLTLNESVYQKIGKWVEKYNVVNFSSEASDGEYELQEGFGWTNGVYAALKFSFL